MTLRSTQSLTEVSAKNLRHLKIIVFNDNGIGRQVYEVRKQVEDFKIDVALFSDTYLKSHTMFYIPNCDFIALAVKKGTKAELPLQLRKASLTLALTYLLSYQ
jgi:hypothetical protein